METIRVGQKYEIINYAYYFYKLTKILLITLLNSHF